MVFDHIDSPRSTSSCSSKDCVGDLVDGVRMGALVGLDQREDVRAQVAQLREEAELVYGRLILLTLAERTQKREHS